MPRIEQVWETPDKVKEDFDIHWGQLNCWKGKRVLDLGADQGSSADYFLEHGAIQVFAVEPDDRWWPKLIENSKVIPQITAFRLKIDSADKLAFLIQGYRPDIVKMDCEGCEIYLKLVPDEIVKIPAEYAIEAHRCEWLNECETKLKNCGFEIIQKYNYLGLDIIYMRRGK